MGDTTNDIPETSEGFDVTRQISADEVLAGVATYDVKERLAEGLAEIKGQDGNVINQPMGVHDDGYDPASRPLYRLAESMGLDIEPAPTAVQSPYVQAFNNAASPTVSEPEVQPDAPTPDEPGMGR